MVLIGVMFVVIVGVADYLTGTEIAFSIFYLIPVSLVSWHAGLRPGVALALVCTVLWYLAEQVGGHQYLNPATAYWNASVRGVIFLFSAVLLVRLKQSLKIEKEARDAALRASKVKSDFLANMSHEIRTPLNSILASAELMNDSSLNSEQREYVQILQQEGQNLLKLINDVLDLSKVEAGYYELQKIPFSLPNLIEQIASAMGVRVHEKRLELHYQLQPGLPAHVLGDPDCLRRVLVNLVGNAVKFTEKGKIGIRVEMDPANSAAGSILFSVSDTGIGISRDKLKLIFERFTQADLSITRRYGGSGLGLNISRKLVELMGGSLSVESTPGQGSRFYFSIPLEVTELEPPEIPALPEVEGPRSWRPAELNILLVDDYEPNRKIIKAFLKNTTAVVEEAENGRIAVEKIKSGGYDLVFMDIQMPELDGIEATREIRRWERQNSRPPLPIVALTAHAFAENVRNSLEAGCNAHLSKPLTRAKLMNSIYSVVGDSARQPETDAAANRGSVQPTLPADLQDLVPGFLAEMKVFRDKLREALDKDDLDSVRNIGHKIAGTGGSYGFQAISEIGRGLEDAGGANRRQELQPLVENFAAYLGQVEAIYGKR